MPHLKDKQPCDRNGLNYTDIFNKYRPGIEDFLEIKTGSKAIAMELAQDTFERILTHTHPASIENLRSYLFKIAANLAKDHLRREKIYVVSADDSELEETSPGSYPGPEDWFMYTNLHERFKIALQLLPVKCREVFFLRRFANLSSSEISQKLGISQRMVQKHLIKAMQRLNKQLR